MRRIGLLAAGLVGSVSLLAVPLATSAHAAPADSDQCTSALTQGEVAAANFLLHPPPFYSLNGLNPTIYTANILSYSIGAVVYPTVPVVVFYNCDRP